MYILVWVLLEKIFEKIFLFVLLMLSIGSSSKSGVRAPPWLAQIFFSSCPLSCLSTRFF